MKLAIVGSVSLIGNREVYRIIDQVIRKYKPDEVVSGGAIGVDTMAKETAKLLNIPVKEFLPRVKNWQEGYKPRNLEIAKYCDRLVRIVTKNSKTYGSGWTRDRVEEMGKPTEEFVV